MTAATNISAAPFFHESWDSTPGTLPQGWTTLGTEKTPDGTAAGLFSKGEGWKILSDGSSPTPFAASYSTTVEGGRMDTWLISPAISVSETGGFMEFPVWTISDPEASPCKMTVRVSTDGGEKESFTSSPLLTKRIGGDGKIESFSLSLAPFAGKEIHLAFVNEGTQAGILCLGDISCNVMTADIRNTTPLMIPEGESLPLGLTLDIKAPCKGFDATLTTSDGETQTISCDKDLSSGLTAYPLAFGNLTPASGILSYTVTVTPRMEGVDPLVARGSAAVGKGYEAVCLMEEATGENCGYCPAGAAAIERFSEMYGKRFVGVGIHCTEQFSTGVMENPGYADPFVSAPDLEITSLPSAVLNRSFISYPTDFNAIYDDVAALMESRTAAEVTVDRVDCDMATGDVTVSFTARLAAPLPVADIRACAILTASGLKGTSRKWYQSDYYSGTTEESFLKAADASWWPYMKFWCEYPSTKVSPTDRAFDHVAMGIYPDYDGAGCAFPSDWSRDTAKSESISFRMPMQTEYDGFGVQDIGNTDITVVLLNGNDGSVLTASQVNGRDYNRDISEINTTEISGNISVRYVNGRVVIDSDIATEARIYSIDGMPLHSGTLSEGRNVIDVNGNGLMIVRVGGRSFKTFAY